MAPALGYQLMCRHRRCRVRARPAARLRRRISGPVDLLRNRMTIHIVRLGTKRLPHEGPRIGTVRRPPRGVPKAEFSSSNWYDVWLPQLAPAAATVKLAQSSSSERDWSAFTK